MSQFDLDIHVTEAAALEPTVLLSTSVSAPIA